MSVYQKAGGRDHPIAELLASERPESGVEKYVGADSKGFEYLPGLPIGNDQPAGGYEKAEPSGNSLSDYRGRIAKESDFPVLRSRISRILFDNPSKN